MGPLSRAAELAAVVFTHLRPFGHDSEILSGVRIVDAAGHTPGHSAVLLHSDGQRLLCVGDLFYHQLQLSHPQWCTPWDHDTVRAVRARRRLLSRAADEHLLITHTTCLSRPRHDRQAWRRLQAATATARWIGALPAAGCHVRFLIRPGAPGSP